MNEKSFNSFNLIRNLPSHVLVELFTEVAKRFLLFTSKIIIVRRVLLLLLKNDLVSITLA